MYVTLKCNFKHNGKRYLAGEKVELDLVLGESVEEIPEEYAKVFEEFVISDEVINLLDSSKKKKKETKNTKSTVKTSKKGALNIDELDMNV